MLVCNGERVHSVCVKYCSTVLCLQCLFVICIYASNLMANHILSGLPRQITKDGLDASFATNHLGPFLLTNLLLGKNLSFHFRYEMMITMTKEIFLLFSSLSLHVSVSFPDLVKRSAPSRIVTVSSMNHKKGEVDFSHFHGENLTYHMDIVYNHTKLHNIICTNELARRLQGTGRLKSRFL